jgi:hypothetical protein
LVFWLSEISKNPKDPFARNDTDRYSFFEFPAGRVKQGKFFPPCDFDCQPYVYFQFTCYETAQHDGLHPYVRSQHRHGNEYFAPETCQIIGPGEDGKLGRGGLITDLSEEDRDNVVNFSTLRVGEIGPNG